MRLSKLGRNRLRTGILAVIVAAGSAVWAAPYDFVPAPQTDLNRVYRIDRVTGEVSSCQYGLQEGTVGATLCFGAAEGPGAQTPGDSGSSSSGTSAKAACSGSISAPVR